MTTEVNLRRILDRKQWELVAPNPSSSVGGFVIPSETSEQYTYHVQSASEFNVYDPNQDSWMRGQTTNMTPSANGHGVGHVQGPRAFATGGTTTTIVTNLNIQRVFKGYSVRIIAGPNAGTEAVIKYNTVGTNSVITVETPFGTAITSASEFILLTGRLYTICAWPASAGLFKYYDVALNTWTNAGITNLPAMQSGDLRLEHTSGTTFVTGTATSATSTTLVNSVKTWSTNNWANYQVRITAGTGAGQFRTISSNTATTLTVSAAWTVTPDATSVYAIEGNDDFIYLIGNAAVTMYRYSISANTWTVLAPAVARAGVTGACVSAHWANKITNPAWTDETNYLNGLYIYSFRSGALPTLDRYNIATNSWESDITYWPKVDAFGSNSVGYAMVDDCIYAMSSQARLYKFNITEYRLEPVSVLLWQNSVSGGVDKMWSVTYTDGATKINYIYYMMVSSPGTPGLTFRLLLF